MYKNADFITFQSKGQLEIDSAYLRTYCIDGITVTDSDVNNIGFDEYIFLWYFAKI